MTDVLERPLDNDDMAALVAALGEATAADLARWFHPIANAFPLMPPAEQDELGQRIAEFGQREPAIILDGLILDGRNRVIQCRKLGIAPRVRPYDPAKDGPDPVALVEDLNLQRRHLSASQRAMAAAEMETIRHGRWSRSKDRNSDLFAGEAKASTPAPTRADLGNRYSVDKSVIADAAKVRDEGSPELREAVKAGDIAVDAAADLTLAPVERQTEILTSLPRDETGQMTPEAKRLVRQAAKELRDEKTAEKRRKRAEREAKLGGKIAAHPDEKFGLILEDFEWRFDGYSRETGVDRAADNHYPTSGMDVALGERAALVASLAADHCVLGMWCTDLARGIDALRARGFEFKSYKVWVKNRLCIDLTPAQRTSIAEIIGRDVPPAIYVSAGAPGTGYWGVDEDEIFLIGTKGNPVCPAMGTQGGTVWYEPKREHSVKPECSYEWIEKHFPNTPRIELNARRRRPGWQVWGNEVEPAPRETVAIEREALQRGLIDKAGMVRVSDSAVVAFGFVTLEEWQRLLAALDRNVADMLNSITVDGGPADLAATRATPFPQSKIISVSTPGWEGDAERFVRAADVHAMDEDELRQQPHVLVTADGFPALHKAFEIVSHDGGAGCGYPDYAVPDHHRMQLGAIETALSELSDDDLETFCIGEQTEQLAIRDRDGGTPALAWAHDLLGKFSERFAGDDGLDIPAFLRRSPT